MNAERLLALYEQVAGAPDAVPRLRRFVLDLAVRGKLVPQDPAGVSPAKLLAQARKDLRARAETAKRMRWKQTDPVSVDEIDKDVPPRWAAARVNDTGLYINGLAFKPADWKQSGIPIIRIQNLTNPTKEFNYAEGDFPDEVIVRKGDLLVSWSATLEAFKWDRGEGVLNQHIFRVIPHEGLADHGFLLLLLRHAIREMADSEHAHGLVMTHINRGPFLNHVVLIPPLAEQRHIVARVDELMALLDRLEAARTAAEATRDRLTAASLARLTAPGTDGAEPGKVETGFASGNATDENPDFPSHARFALATLPALTARADQIKPLRQTILNLAVRGKLVAQDPNDEPLPRMDKGMPSGAKPPFAIPTGWQWSRLRFLGTLKGGGTPSKACDDFWNGNIPWVSPKDMKVDYIDAAQLSITNAAVVGSAVNLIEPGSVLFVVRGMILAHSFPVAISRVPLTINQDMKAIILTKPEMAEYTLRALKGLTPEMLARVQRSSHGTCRIDGSNYGDFLIPLPPLAEQHRIVARVDALMALCDRLEAALAAAEATRARLLEALLVETLTPTPDPVTEAAE